MKHSVTYPLVGHPCDPSLLTRAGVVRFAQAAEQAGFDGIGFTDHPAPTHRWLQAGGHDALDPFAALAFCAAVTERIRLIPNVVVLPYRNPFISAKAAATLDMLSEGRFTLAVAAGYLKGEYRALGVDFDRRNEIFDEAIDVIRGVWSTDDFTFDGDTVSALGQTVNPKPAGSLPIWIGGNSRRARRRVAERGDGWVPFPTAAAGAATARTSPLTTVADLAVLIEDLWELLDAAGRSRSSIDIAFSNLRGGVIGSNTFDADETLAGEAELAELGVTWINVSVPGDDLDRAIDALARYGDEVIARQP